jgi:hypothetical protein
LRGDDPSPEVRIIVYLLHVVQGQSQRFISMKLNMGSNNVDKCIIEVSVAIVDMRIARMGLPMALDGYINMERFYNLTGIPSIFGVLDVLKVPIYRPMDHNPHLHNQTTVVYINVQCLLPDLAVLSVDIN